MRRMKRTIRIVSLVLVLVMALTMTTVFASAATQTVPVVYGVKMNSGYTAKLVDNGTDKLAEYSGLVGAKSRNVFENVEKIDVTFNGKAGEYYMVFLVMGDETDTKIVPGSDNIFYINQITSDGSDTVTIYPKDLETAGHYRIYVAGDGKYMHAGSLNVATSWEDYAYSLGDVNGDDKLDILDAAQLLKILAQLADGPEKGSESFTRTDVDSSSSLSILDAAKILKKLAQLSISIEEG